MGSMSDYDESKFRELFENGLLTARPPEVWLPQKSKDGEWKNHFIGSTGAPMHLSGGWMINGAVEGSTLTHDYRGLQQPIKGSFLAPRRGSSHHVT